MYWDQPLLECQWPQQADPFDVLLGDTHVLFYDRQFDFRGLRTNQRIGDLCAWAEQGLAQGIDAFAKEPQNHYDIANLVKLNMWASDIRQQGIVKPWLILDWGDYREAGTGDSRLRLCEIMPEITSVPAFISTHRDRVDHYPGLEKVTTFKRFGELCGARLQQQFLFRGTNAEAPFGIYWYEFDSDLTRAVTPDQAWCVRVFQEYYRLNRPEITPAWFLIPVQWQQFDKKNLLP